LFELYEKVQKGEIKKIILDNWKNEHGPIYLDLHEKADGPHMLVAG